MARVGLKNIVVAKLLTDTEEGTTYGAVRKLKPAMSANITPNFEKAELYGDDQLQEVEEALSSIDVEIGVNDLDLEEYAYIMGKTVDSQGGVADGGETAPYLALGYEMPLSGNKGSRYVWLYKGKFTAPSEEATTKQGSVEFQTPTITGTFMQRVSDAKWRYRVETNANNSALTSTWFEEVKSPPTVVSGD